MLKASKDRIILERIVEEKKGTLLLPTEKKENRGTVLDVGKDVMDDIENGDIVIFAPYAPIEIVHEDKTYLVITEKDIIAIEVK